VPLVILGLQHNSSITCRLKSAFISVQPCRILRAFLYLSQTPISCDKFVWLASLPACQLANDLFVTSLGYSFWACVCCQIWWLLLRGGDLRWEYFMPRYVSWLRLYSNGQPKDADEDERELVVADLLPLSSGSLSRI